MILVSKGSMSFRICSNICSFVIDITDADSEEDVEEPDDDEDPFEEDELVEEKEQDDSWEFKETHDSNNEEADESC